MSISFPALQRPFNALVIAFHLSDAPLHEILSSIRDWLIGNIIFLLPNTQTKVDELDFAQYNINEVYCQAGSPATLFDTIQELSGFQLHKNVLLAENHSISFDILVSAPSDMKP